MFLQARNYKLEKVIYHTYNYDIFYGLQIDFTSLLICDLCPYTVYDYIFLTLSTLPPLFFLSMSAKFKK